MADENIALLAWVNSFELERTVNDLAELSDGAILSIICNQIAPDYFSIPLISENVEGNWVIASTNIKKILRSLDNLFKSVLSKRLDLTHIDAIAIARDCDVDLIFSLIEAIVGAAMTSPCKATFIERIFSLDGASQAVLKRVIEHVMTNLEDFANDDTESVEDEADTGDVYEELRRARELIRHLSDERGRLLHSVEALEAQNAALHSESDNLLAELRKPQRPPHASGSPSAVRGGGSGVRLAVAHSAAEAEETRRKLDLQCVENENLRASLKAAQQRAEASKDMQTKLEVEMQLMTDELDIAREKSTRLTKAEATIEKYQKKLEELVVLKKDNKELLDKMDQYLDRIQELETSHKSVSTLNRLIDGYKSKMQEFEREKLEASSRIQILETDLRRARAEADGATAARRQLENDLVRARQDSVAFALSPRASASTAGCADDSASDVFGGEVTMASLKEQVHKLQHELRIHESASPLTDSSRHSPLAEDVTFLQAELDGVRNARQSAEDLLLATKRQLADVTAELARSTLSIHEMEDIRVGDVLSRDALREMEQKYHIAENSRRLLEDKLCEKEELIDKLEQDKSKLETYARRTLVAFKEKYLAALQTIKSEKKALEEKLATLSEQSSRNQETARREERLMTAAVYDVGMRLVERRIQEQIHERSGGAPPSPSRHSSLATPRSPGSPNEATHSSFTQAMVSPAKVKSPALANLFNPFTSKS